MSADFPPLGHSGANTNDLRTPPWLNQKSRADMDADARRMLADLGLQRRDELSAPDADAKGRECHEDPRMTAAIMTEVEARRAHYTGAVSDADGGDGPTARLRAWNMPSSFEQDERTERLENRWSGQGHRAGLKRQRQYDDRAEAFDARFGEERRLYALQRQRARYSNHGAAPPASTKQDRFREQVLGERAATPRPSSGGHQFHHGGRRVATLPQAPDRARASSPRRFGTVRFRPAERRSEEKAARQPAMVNPGVQAAAALRSTATRDDQASKETTRALTPTPAPHSAEPAPAQAQSSTASDDPIRAQVHFNQALWHAANPGEERDDYYARFPSRLKYLKPALHRLINETIDLAKKGDAEETARYIETHRDRKWMVEAAEKAKSLIETGVDAAAIEAYCAENARQMDFVHAARKIFTSMPKPVVVVQSPIEDLLGMEAAVKPIDTSTSGSRFSSPPTESQDSSSRSSDAEGRAKTAGSSSLPSWARGSLAVKFFDAVGKCLGEYQATVRAPVQASLTINAKTASFNPRQLVHCVEALAQGMVDRTNGLAGARLEEDGVWVEDDL